MGPQCRRRIKSLIPLTGLIFIRALLSQFNLCFKLGRIVLISENKKIPVGFSRTNIKIAPGVGAGTAPSLVSLTLSFAQPTLFLHSRRRGVNFKARRQHFISQGAAVGPLAFQNTYLHDLANWDNKLLVQCPTLIG